MTNYLISFIFSSPLNMLDGYENRLAYCAAFGSMTFELTSILWNPNGRFTSFAIGHSVMYNPTINAYPVLRCKYLSSIATASIL